MSSATKVRKLPMCPRAYTVRPQVYIRTVLSCAGAKSSSRRVSVLYKRIRVTDDGARENRARSGGQRTTNLGRSAAAVRFDLELAVDLAEVERNLGIGRGRCHLGCHAFDGNL